MVEAGYNVTVTGLYDEQVAAVPQSQHFSAVRLDVTCAESVAAVFGCFHELAALINCAGVIFRGGAEYDIDTFKKVIDVNLTGTMRMCIACRPLLAARGGSIVTGVILPVDGGYLIT